METKNISSNIDSLKYLHLQANVHMKYIKEYILSSTKLQIENFKLADKRFKIKIVPKEDNNTTKYYIFIQTNDDMHVRLFSSIIKN